jgi:hypothetical protein
MTSITNYPRATFATRPVDQHDFRYSFQHFEQDQFHIGGLAQPSQDKLGDFLAGAVMRWMTQKWIVPREGETVWDVVLDATMALFSAAVATEVIQIVFSAL